MSTFLTSGPFWVSTLERAVKTVAQSAVATLTAGVVGILDADWLTVASVAGLAGAVSLLTSIASGAATDGSPSLAAEKLDEPR